MAIHNNYIIGAAAKLQRFQNASLWFVRPDLVCEPFPRHLPPAPAPPLEFVLKVRCRAVSGPAPATAHGTARVAVDGGGRGAAGVRRAWRGPRSRS